MLPFNVNLILKHLKVQVVANVCFIGEEDAINVDSKVPDYTFIFLNWLPF